MDTMATAQRTLHVELLDPPRPWPLERGQDPSPICLDTYAPGDIVMRLYRGGSRESPAYVFSINSTKEFHLPGQSDVQKVPTDILLCRTIDVHPTVSPLFIEGLRATLDSILQTPDTKVSYARGLAQTTDSYFLMMRGLSGVLGVDGKKYLPPSNIQSPGFDYGSIFTSLIEMVTPLDGDGPDEPPSPTDPEAEGLTFEERAFALQFGVHLVYYLSEIRSLIPLPLAELAGQLRRSRSRIGPHKP